LAVRHVVLGWDSATFDVIDPMIEDGRLPVLADIIGQGTRAPLRSVWPPMTDCAWTSAFTGRNPGGHGIFGSWYRAPGEYACRYFSSRNRLAPALWDLTDDVRFLVWNVPMTYPPTEVNGAIVAGYGAPPGAQITEPKELQQRLTERWPIADLLDRAPHGTLESFLEELVRGLQAQGEALPWTASEVGADCVIAVWPQVDRAQHFFWRLRGTSHPLASAVETVYEEMDRATGALRDAWPDADFLVVSDHGAGPLRGDVNMGAWLVERGYARAGRSGGGTLARTAWAMPPPVRRLGRRLMPGLARKTMGATLTGQLGSFDWSETRAFVGFHGDLWLNLQGREPQGTVAESDAEMTRNELAEQLLQLRDPRTDARVFERVLARDEVYSGPALHLAPDLMLDSWSAGYRVAPSRDPEGDLVGDPLHLSGVQEAWSSDHRPVGIFAAAGPRITKGKGTELSLMDVCATSLALLEQEVPADLDGRVATSILAPGFLAEHPVRTGATSVGSAPGGGSQEYSDEEAAAVAEHLKDLGYID
jgi:predicted AlkP superfamily phosphohydrolase/phosphomutase